MQKQYDIQWRDNFKEIENHAKSLHTEVKELQKDTKKLGDAEYAKGLNTMFEKSIQEIKKADQLINDLKNSMEGLGKNSKARASIEKELNQTLYQKQKIMKGINEIIKTINASEDKQLQNEMKITSQKLATYKEEKKIQNAQIASNKAEQRRIELAKQKESAEKRLLQIKKEQQEIMRILYDQEYGAKAGKKTKTPLDLAYLKEQQKALNDEAAKFEKILGKNSKAVKSYKNGLDFTQRNNPFRLWRDEATKLSKDIPKLQKNLTKLKIDPVANKNQITQTEKELSKLENRFKRIQQAFQAGINREQRQGRQGAYLSEEDYQWIQKVLPLIQKEVELEKQKVIERQSAVNADKIEAQNKQQQIEQQKQQYKSLKTDLQSIWNIENKMVQLQKDPKKNAAQIQYYQQLLEKKREELNLVSRARGLSEEQRKNIKKMAKEQKEYNTLLKKQNQDWMNNRKSAQGLGDTIKKVFNYVLVYKFFNLLQEGIRSAIETMKDLDKAFTDIQMVTGDTDEQTAQLAQDYNKLAKSLGATTQEVAEGAAEWLRQGKTTEETTQLLTSSMTLSKVGAMEASEATELLTSTLNGYKLEAKDAMAVVDKISSIDLAAATSSYELASALSRTANSAKDAGVTFEKLLAMIGTVSSVTRKSASTIRRIF